MTDERVEAWGYLEPAPADPHEPDSSSQADESNSSVGSARVRGATEYSVVDPVTDRILDTFTDEQSALEYASRENNAFVGELQVQEAKR